MPTEPSSSGIAPKAPEREPLPPGVLPTLTDTDPPPLHPSTIVRDGYVGVDHNWQPPPHSQHQAQHQGHQEQHQGPSGSSKR
jgi:hypothetical protein